MPKSSLPFCENGGRWGWFKKLSLTFECGAVKAEPIWEVLQIILYVTYENTEDTTEWLIFPV